MARGVTFFPAVGEKARPLAEKIRSSSRRSAASFAKRPTTTVRAGAQAQLCDDVVIYDLSGSDDNTGPSTAGPTRSHSHSRRAGSDRRTRRSTPRL